MIAADNPVRVVDAFIDALDLKELGFAVTPEPTGRPGYHPAAMLKIYLYGYLNQVQSSRRLERECQRNLELIWLTGSLAPDFKTIADFRRDNGPAIRSVCRRFVALCRNLHLLDEGRVAIDGSKFKAVNNREKNFTHERLKRRLAAIDDTLGKATAAYDEVTVLATKEKDVESLAKIIDDKINTIQRGERQRAVDEMVRKLGDESAAYAIQTNKTGAVRITSSAT